jgi:hypothetical protein
MKLTIEINTDNEVFRSGSVEEVKRIIIEGIEKLNIAMTSDVWSTSIGLFDINGNRVGILEYK